MEYLVYLVKSPSNKYYVGITTQEFLERKRKHFLSSKIAKTKFHKALKKYANKMFWKIIYRAKSKKDMLNKEKFFIKKYDSYKKGYNSTLGGELNLGRKVSKKTRKILSNLNTGKNNPNFGIKKSITTIEKIAKSNGTKPFMVFKNTKIVGVWKSKKKCARDLRLNYQYISFCLRKKYGFKSHKGYIFKYAEEISC